MPKSPSLGHVFRPDCARSHPMCGTICSQGGADLLPPLRGPIKASWRSKNQPFSFQGRIRLCGEAELQEFVLARCSLAKWLGEPWTEHGLHRFTPARHRISYSASAIPPMALCINAEPKQEFRLINDSVELVLRWRRDFDMWPWPELGTVAGGVNVHYVSLSVVLKFMFM